jgi:hypothetical protein
MRTKIVTQSQTRLRVPPPEYKRFPVSKSRAETGFCCLDPRMVLMLCYESRKHQKWLQKRICSLSVVQDCISAVIKLGIE